MKNFETLEVGKTYKNRRGDLVKIAGYMDDGRSSSTYISNCNISYDKNGNYLENHEHKFDLIELVGVDEEYIGHFSKTLEGAEFYIKKDNSEVLCQRGSLILGKMKRYEGVWRFYPDSDIFITKAELFSIWDVLDVMQMRERMGCNK